MNEKKNIERLFQEKFKDFEVTPSPRIWGNIASELEKKENKKRVIPFWFNLKAAGIAAGLILGYFVVNNYTNVSDLHQVKSDSNNVVFLEKNENESSKEENLKSNKKNQTTIVNHDKSIVDDNAIESSAINNKAIPNQNNSIVSTQKGSIIHNKDAVKNNDDENFTLNNKTISNNNSPLVSHQKPSTNHNIAIIENNDKKSSTKNNKIILNKQSSIVLTQKSTKEVNLEKNKISNNRNLIGAKESKVNEDLLSNRIQKNHLNKSLTETIVSTEVSTKKLSEKSNSYDATYFGKTKREKYKKIHQNENRELVENSKIKNSGVNSNEKIVLNSKVPSSNKLSEPLIQNNVPVNASSNLNEKLKEGNTNFGGINNSSIVNTTIPKGDLPVLIAKDSVVIALVEENPLDKILKEKENKDKEGNKIAMSSKKWKIKPNVAPLFMNASQGSPIDDQFADNTKDFENNLSLGLGVDYAVSKKLSIRTGVNKFDFNYNTKDIVYYSDFASKSSNSVENLKTLNILPQANNMVIEDKGINVSPEIAIQTKDEGLLNQRIGYLEVPVEISYKLLDKKFGIQFITGFSTLFLNENKVSVVSSGLTTNVGEANNLNKVHFSTNIGLGFKYSFWKSFEANFEPTFKYQINTFNTNSGGFKPYLIGLYTGISFKF